MKRNTSSEGNGPNTEKTKNSEDIVNTAENIECTIYVSLIILILNIPKSRNTLANTLMSEVTLIIHLIKKVKL